MHEQLCPFERVILSMQFSCSESHKFFYAHKEGIACKNAPARLNCKLVIEYLKQNSKFALKLSQTDDGKLTHGQEMKIKCGGLQGLQGLFGDEHDIHTLVNTALSRFPDADSLPWDQVMPSVQSFKLRQARGPR